MISFSFLGAKSHKSFYFWSSYFSILPFKSSSSRNGEIGLLFSSEVSIRLEVIKGAEFSVSESYLSM